MKNTTEFTHEELIQLNKIYESIHNAARAMAANPGIEIKSSVILDVARYLQKILLNECIQTYYPSIIQTEDEEFIMDYQYPVIELDISNLD